MYLKSILLAGASGLMVALPGFAQACPDPEGTDYTSVLSGDDFASGLTISVQAGGSLDLADCNDLPGVGKVVESPDFKLVYSALLEDLTLETSASCDTVMLVHDADGGWHFDDDAGGDSNAKLTLEDASEGTIEVWVGTFEDDVCPASLTVTSGADLAPSCPDFGLSGDEHTFSAADLTGGQSLDVYAGGDIDLAGCETLPGVGQVIEAPDFTLTYETDGNYDLSLKTEAQCDTVLLVNDPSAEWIWDDDSGENGGAMVTLEAAEPGLIDVWIGTFEENTCEAKLLLETVERDG